MFTVPAAFSEASLLLSILQESPSRLLGRLVFEVGVLPQRLQLLMASFHHMHMMEVLVKCCCPQLPAHSAVTTPRGEELCMLHVNDRFHSPCLVLHHNSYLSAPHFTLHYSTDLPHFVTLTLLLSPSHHSPLQHSPHAGPWWLSMMVRVREMAPPSVISVSSLRSYSLTSCLS